MEKTINVLTQKEYPLVFSFLNGEDPYHEEKGHRRGSSFYVTETYFIDQDTLDEFKQEYGYREDDDRFDFLLGYWQTPCRMWTDDWGFDDDLDYLQRVERTIKVIEQEVFTLVKEDGE